MMDSYERVHEYLSKPGMTTMENIIDTYLETSHDRPVMDILDHLLPEELMHKLSKKTENMLNRSGFPFRKTIDDFDFSFLYCLSQFQMNNYIRLMEGQGRYGKLFSCGPG